MQPINKKFDIGQYLSDEIKIIFNKIISYCESNNTYIELTPEFFVYFCLSDGNQNLMYNVVNTFVNTISINEIVNRLSKDNWTVKVKPMSTVDLKLSDSMSKYFQKALNELNNVNSTSITSDIVLISIIKSNNVITDIFTQYGLTYDRMVELSLSFHNSIAINQSKIESQSVVKSKSPNGLQQSKNAIKFCTNLTQEAKDGNVDEVFFRDKEILNIENILQRRKTNNAIIVGDTGVGKTALINGIAYNISNGLCDNNLSDYKVYVLNFNEIAGGTGVRGVFEDRITLIFSELKKQKNSVFVIEDIHKYVGKHRSDDFNLLATLSKYYDDNKYKIIFTTTVEGYKSIVNTDNTVVRKFKKVVLSPLSKENTTKIISNIKNLYETHHSVKYSDEALRQIIDLSERFITDIPLPTSAIDMMDDIGSRMAIDIINGNCTDNVITDDYAFKVFSDRTNIPVTKLTTSEKATISKLYDTLNSKIIGQEEAIKDVSNAIKRSKIGLFPKNKPIYSCMCIGNTGCGKTLMAKTLAKELFGDEKHLVRFDMSEYSDKTSVNKLIGSSNGYIGFEKGGLLTEAVKNNKHCVLLIDEIEKANEEVYSLFLQILDEGFVTDNMGVKVDFKNTIVIMTSNVGAHKANSNSTIGFFKNESITKKETIKKELKTKFPPEFINRLDDVIYFNDLTDDNLKTIISNELEMYENRLVVLGHNVTICNEMTDFIFKKIESEKEYGARPISRAITDYVYNAFADYYLSSDEEYCNITININNDKVICQKNEVAV